MTRPQWRYAAVFLIAILTLAGCAGQQASPAPVQSVALGPPHRGPAGNLFPALLQHSRDLGPVANSQQVSFLVLLRNPSAARQQKDLNAIYDPHSPRFGHYESPSQWAARYGPPSGAVQAARRHLGRLGLTSRWQPGSLSMTISGPASVVDRIFGIQIHWYRAAAGQRFWASMRDPGLPTWLRTVVASTGHLSSYAVSTLGPALHPTRLVPPDGLTPSDVLTAYDIRPLRQRGFDGTGQTIVFIEIDGYHQSDLNDFTSHFNLPAMHPQIKFGSRLSDVAGETELDMEVAHEIAPGARLLLYNCSANCSSSDIVGAETRAAKDNPGGVISVSLGLCEPTEGSGDANAERSAFDQADAAGESVFVSSGDSGAFECLTQNWGAPPTSEYVGISCPACVPSVTAVGGTHLSLNRDGSWYREYAWQDALGTGGTGGGVSTLFHRPSWQKGPGTNNSFDTNGMREIPDVSADADPLTSIAIDVNGEFTEEGGTSQAAPMWAAITVLINQYLRSKGLQAAGFLNPALYALAATSQPYAPFHDVTTGTNLYYPATPGYDLATGLGTPDVWNLARDLAGYEKGR